jgi:conjugal transfer/type IV secretion protein DotA/TraY
VAQFILAFFPTLTLNNNIVFTLLSKLGYLMMAGGLLLKFYIPIIPFVRTAMAVLTWIISVFEAVVLVPVAALAHLSTTGEGLAGNAGHVWKLWLNILLRPVMTVIGFVGAMLVYNAFISYLHDSFIEAAAAGMPTQGFLGLFSGVALAMIYVFVMYSVANSVFKMLDLIPDALMRWIGGPAPDRSFDSMDDKAVILGVTNMISGLPGGQAPKGGAKPPGPPAPAAGTETKA